VLSTHPLPSPQERVAEGRMRGLVATGLTIYPYGLKAEVGLRVHLQVRYGACAHTRSKASVKRATAAGSEMKIAFSKL